MERIRLVKKNNFDPQHEWEGFSFSNEILQLFELTTSKNLPANSTQTKGMAKANRPMMDASEQIAEEKQSRKMQVKKLN